MKKIIFLFFILSLIFTINSCDGREECFTSPQPVYFKFVDAATGENLITNGTILPVDFQLKDDSNTSENFTVITENNLNAVQVNSGWFEGTKNFTFNLGNSKSFKFKVTSKKLTGKCGGYIVEKVEIVDQAFSRDSYFYLIKFDN